MYARILVTTDGSDITATAVAQAVELAQKLGSQLYALTVTEPYPYSPLAETQPISPQEHLDAELRVANARLLAVQNAASAAGVRCEASSVEGTQPWRAIVDHAERIKADLLVMASHGRRGVSALLLGSETQKVLTHSKIPVLVVR
ncbi:universal stress protein [Inhella proteolytica]|uniref:Universal stress protein n=1 Tax=Inhella proteolytica TaxID=2795029 RepID=A0A931J8T5_9BURK|nr:universal stress protein [Inhella proteolytica]MBH9578205.1 universal stress protein [Inhella proteolytica]